MFAAALVPSIVGADTSVDWPDLIDAEAQVFDDPFRNLSEDQIDLLRTIVRAREKLARGSAPVEEIPEVEARLENALQTLAQAGIDADDLIDLRWTVAGLRETAANAGNPALDGSEVSLAGFAIPAPPEADGTSTVYLVELAGMCSHTPPPPPNQLIRVRLSDGWRPDYMHQPVRIRGRVHIDPSERVFPVVDGDVPMKATWRLDADSVEAFTPKPRAEGASSDWVEQLRAQLKSRRNSADE
ncbi:DUF3299 domain-containing protein [Ruegeria sediminis]|uniref:DUF3299 domain-containing protein n=1 Tax=Ruegeria sediminis TaxID=2583820 RepID=UPI001C556970|nr:DUF3299 domain-containing protein [Ruegeria sediminis]